MTDTFTKVGEFHGKFGLPTAHSTPPAFPPDDVLQFRGGFLLEELAEFFEACGNAAMALHLREAIKDLGRFKQVYGFTGPRDLEKAADALADLKYVTDGTAHMMGIPFNEVFEEVQRANMTKERATGADDPRNTRPHALNVVKPEGWTPPDHKPILERHAARFSAAGGFDDKV